MRSEHIKSYKYCTKSEVEILVIINEGLYDDFLKAPKNTKPKSFIHEYMPSYKPSKYFREHDMVGALQEYKRVKKHNKDELFLIDLLSIK